MLSGRFSVIEQKMSHGVSPTLCRSLPAAESRHVIHAATTALSSLACFIADAVRSVRTFAGVF